MPKKLQVSKNQRISGLYSRFYSIIYHPLGKRLSMLFHNRKDSANQEAYKKGTTEGYFQGRTESQAKIREMEAKIFELEERMRGNEAQVSLVGRLLSELVSDRSEMTNDMRRKVLERLSELKLT